MMKIMQGKAALEKSTATVLGPGSIFEAATLKGSGGVRIDGKFSGTIDIEGHFVLGETGILDGEVRADSSLLAGKYKGNLFIKDTLHVAATANLVGRIESGKLIVDEGAAFNCVCNVATADVITSIAANNVIGISSESLNEKEVVLNDGIKDGAL